MKAIDRTTSNAVYDIAMFAILNKLVDFKTEEVTIVIKIQEGFYDRDVQAGYGLDEDAPLLDEVKAALSGLDNQTLLLANIANGEYENAGMVGTWSLPVTNQAYSAARRRAAQTAVAMVAELV